MSGKPSRDPEFAREALRTIIGTKIPFAVVHDESRIAARTFTSDVDLIVDIEFSVLLRRIANPLRAAGIRPILVWPYDVGATTLFVSNKDSTRGAQLDFLWDTTGTGKYGLDVRRLLRSVEMGAAFPRVSHLHELLYLARKRQVKEQWEECRRILERLSSIPEAAAEVNRVFVGPVRHEVRKLLEGDVMPARLRPQRVVAETARLVGRIRRPIGVWIEVIGSEEADIVAEAITDRFGAILPHVGLGRRPRGTPMELHWMAREVAPIRWRAGLYASSAYRVQRPLADVHVSGGEDIDSSIYSVVEWLEQRLLA